MAPAGSPGCPGSQLGHRSFPPLSFTPPSPSPSHGAVKVSGDRNTSPVPILVPHPYTTPRCLAVTWQVQSCKGWHGLTACDAKPNLLLFIPRSLFSTPHPTPSFLSPPPLLLLPGNLGLQLPFRAAKAARYPHRSWSEQCHCRAAGLRKRRHCCWMRQNSLVQPCPGRSTPAAQGFAVLLFPAARWAPSMSHENAVLQFLEEPTCALHRACWRASHGKLCMGS